MTRPSKPSEAHCNGVEPPMPLEVTTPRRVRCDAVFVTAIRRVTPQGIALVTAHVTDRMSLDAVRGEADSATTVLGQADHRDRFAEDRVACCT
jgi:hypothetical protein